MYRELVVSSNIRAVGYSEQSQTLEIEFHNGRVYQYANVSQGTYEGLMNASSKGQYFDREIKRQPSVYPYSRIN